MRANRSNRDKIIRRFCEKETPDWVEHFPGPLQTGTPQSVAEEMFNDDFRLVLTKWAQTHMDNNMLSNIVVPFLSWKGPKAELDYTLILGHPEDALRFGRMHPKKDEANLPIVSQNVVNTPDVEQWKSTRSGIIDAFLPISELAGRVEEIDADAASLVASMQSRGPIVDIKDEMHHAAFSIYLHSLLGVVDPFGKPLPQTCPADSHRIRDIFSLEIVGELGSEKMIERLGHGMEFVNEVIEKAKAQGNMTSLLSSVLELDDGPRMENLMALMTAGHDTTAYTTQFCLFELARHPELQKEAREEALKVLRETDGKLSYGDLQKFEFIGRCITETLRLWNVAMFTFGRRTTVEDEVVGIDGKPAKIPPGTRFNFWFYGHHHSSEFWGKDAYVFNPHRQFHEHEMQKGACPEEARFSAQTPCTRRFHPFSVPRRDCMGKNFAMIEMKLLVARMLESYTFDLAGETLKDREVAPQPSNEVYQRWCRDIPGTVQPRNIYLKIAPNAARL